MDDRAECGGDGSDSCDWRLPAAYAVLQEGSFPVYDQCVLFGSAIADLGHQYISLLKTPMLSRITPVFFID